MLWRTGEYRYPKTKTKKLDVQKKLGTTVHVLIRTLWAQLYKTRRFFFALDRSATRITRSCVWTVLYIYMYIYIRSEEGITRPLCPTHLFAGLAVLPATVQPPLLLSVIVANVDDDDDAADIHGRYPRRLPLAAGTVVVGMGGLSSGPLKPVFAGATIARNRPLARTFPDTMPLNISNSSAVLPLYAL